MSDEDDGTSGAGIASTRSRRQRSSRAEKTSDALEKIKRLRGSKNKYEMVEEKPVYDVVDEEEYSSIVIKRQKEDWIVDDQVGDYYEDGREIFDDEVDSDDDYGRSSSSRGIKRKSKQPIKKSKPGMAAVDEEGQIDEEAREIRKNNIKEMFMRIQEKPKKMMKMSEVKVEEDVLLEGILSDIHQIGSAEAGEPMESKAFKLERKPRKIVSEQSTTTKRATAVNQSTRLRNINQFRKTSLGVSVEVMAEKTDSNSISSELDKILKEADAESDFALLEDNFELGGDLGPTVKMECDEQTSVENENPQKPNDEWASNYDGNEEANKNLGVSIPQEYEKELEFYKKDEASSDRFLEFYWTDVHEQYSSPGTVYVFGKMKLKSIEKYVSCCVLVKNIEKRIFLLPRKFRKSDPSKEVKVKDVYDEFNSMTSRFKISSFKSKATTKFYAFEMADVPTEATYLEVHIPSTANIPSDLEGDTFSRCFGTNQSGLERLLLDCKMKGPGWAAIKNPTISSPPVSWCKLEFVIDNLKFLEVTESSNPAPTFQLMSLALKTYLNPNTRQNEIVAISVLLNRDFNVETGLAKSEDGKGPGCRKFDAHFVIVTKPSPSSQIIFPIDLIPSKIPQQYKKTKINVVNSERELINCFMAKFYQVDPDVVIGHDIVEFDIEVLVSRMLHHKIGLTWSKLGRLRKTQAPSLKRRDRPGLTCGRLVADVKRSSQELIRSTSWDLTELANNILKRKRFASENTDLKVFYSSSKNFFKWVDLMMIDNDLIISIFYELNILPLSLQITKIAGNSFSRTLSGGRAERNEYLLLHAFHEKGHIYPDKYRNMNSTSGPLKKSDDIADLEGEALEDQVVKNDKKKGPSYVGGLVLDPKVGFYNHFVLILDFNSLYPTIMREFNICFTTINLRDPRLNDDDDDFVPPIPDPDSVPGILPTEITKLVESRREVKKLLQQPNLPSDQKVQLDIKQKALKLTANSMYGCLGFSHSRFYAKPLAALITFKGREILMATKVLVESMGFEVIYGDTDSIMINTKCDSYDDALKISTQVQAAVNGQYKHLEIDCDGVLKSMLLLKKKKYAALTVSRHPKTRQVTYSKELKGLDIVRRDWSIIAKKSGEKVVDEILSLEAKSCDTIVDNIHTYLKQLAEMIRSNQLPLESFIITKSLTKNPEDYPDKKSLSHVSVALEWNEWNTSGKKFRAGDVISYIVVLRNGEDEDCKKFNALPATQRAIHPDMFNADPTKHKVDVDYYLSQQVHPVISRLVEPIEGTDANAIAEMLGIESTHCSVKVESQQETFLASGEDRYDVCSPLTINCPKCGAGHNFRKPIEVITDPGNKSTTFKLTFSRCSGCSSNFKTTEMMSNFQKQIQLILRNMLNSFYAGWMTCEDPICKHTSRLVSGPVRRRGPECSECKSSCMFLSVTPAQLHLQLSFYEFILDLSCIEISKYGDSIELQDDFSRLKPLMSPLLAMVKEMKSNMGYNIVHLEYLFKKQEFLSFKS